MKVWLLTYDCGDYYCDGTHVVGAYSCLENAEIGREDFVDNWREKNPNASIVYPAQYEYFVSEYDLDRTYDADDNRTVPWRGVR